MTIRKEKQAEEEMNISSQKLEDLTDDIKQRFIRDYKTCYNE
jgi:hypothetical protein